MFEAVSSPYLVPFDGAFRIKKAPTAPPPKAPGKKACKEGLQDLVDQLDELQRLLYAHDNHALLLVFQAMDAAGKDSTIRAVMSGVNPAGCQVFSFKQPSTEELDHDFLWRTVRCLPERGRIGIFNRSYYEEVLVVRVHPEYLGAQKLPDRNPTETFWQERCASIGDHERHLALNGTVVVKFWLNVSEEEQRRRFLSRLDEPHKHWKFAPADVEERRHWKAYMDAYEAVLNATSRPWAPWYAIPADDKPFMRLCVAEIVVQTLKSLGLAYPKIGKRQRDRFETMRLELEKEG
ncbi:MAG: phosphate--nucleotide phosphotransferase [Desulfuromonas sp.]|uniref:polyphosphate kinase 2 family protein n=1 Tax=Desulfuromonas sp. TaxID=892 RepID=UPI000CCA691D|nr:polyphosphate kinase 2 family protein [Desulfuromonas sp.]PLX86283.1 MAG: phosphate--nucleotide phosphotransferase [Desulfuromonas sp.]